jgi:hypothetical protein
MKQDESLRAAVAAKESRDNSKVAELIAQGVKPVHTVYADGGQNPSFSARYIPGVSRPDALAQGPVEVPLDDKVLNKVSPAVQVAAAKDKSKSKQPVNVAAASSTTKPPPNTANTPPTVAAAQPAAPQAPAEPVKSAGSLFASLWGGQNAPQQPETPAPLTAYAPADVPLPPQR